MKQEPLTPNGKRAIIFDDIVSAFNDQNMRLSDYEEQDLDELLRDWKDARLDCKSKAARMARIIRGEVNICNAAPGTKANLMDAIKDINTTTDLCFELSSRAGWWSGPEGEKLDVDAETPKKLLLIHSEVSEACEGFRKGLNDDHLPTRTMFATELADAAIRIFDLAGAHGIDLGGTIMEKLIYNARRADHKQENRAKDGGKKF